jgi:hypothetical protein
MFTPLLYDHKFDIDDLIRALLDDRTPRHFLDTRSGALTDQPAPEAEDGHGFTLMPLPPGWLATLPDHDFYPRLPAEAKAELQTLLAQNPPLHALLPLVQGPTALGGWLRERAKEAAMQWLADNDLIPPSMRHIAGTPTRQTPAAPLSGPVRKVVLT